MTLERELLSFEATIPHYGDAAWLCRWRRMRLIIPFGGITSIGIGASLCHSEVKRHRRYRLSAAQVYDVLDVVSFILVTTDLAGEERLTRWRQKILAIKVRGHEQWWAAPYMMWFLVLSGGPGRYATNRARSAFLLFLSMILGVLYAILYGLLLIFLPLPFVGLLLAFLAGLPTFVILTLIVSGLLFLVLDFPVYFLSFFIWLLNRWPLDGLMLAVGSAIFVLTRVYRVFFV